MDADLVAAAAALRWARPDLTAALAGHVVEEAAAAGDRDRWLAAAGWAVHAAAATGDGRVTACEVLGGLGQWGAGVLAAPSARRLRVELAVVAAGAGEVGQAERLLAPVLADTAGIDAELAADVLCAQARCAIEDASDSVSSALDAAESAWAQVGGQSGALGGASVALVRAVVERRAGRPAGAVDRAAEGLARLERGRGSAVSPSRHLAAALAAEWISALLDAGRAGEAHDGCTALLPRLVEQGRPTRQLALLRLTVARAVAAADAGADSATLLEQAADDAAGADVPDLESVCRTALGALHEQAGQLDTALEALQRGVAAERRDRDRARRFLAALAELPLGPEPSARPEVDAAGDRTTVLPAITRKDRKLKSGRAEQVEATTGSADAAVNGWGAVPWSASGGDSPIGDLLISSLRTGATETVENGNGNGNGASRSRNGSGRRMRHGGPESSEPGGASTPAAGGRAARRRSAESAGAVTGRPALDDERSDARPGRRRRAETRDAGDAGDTTPAAGLPEADPAGVVAPVRAAPAGTGTNRAANGAGATGSGATGAAANGTGANGTGANGTGANGTGANGTAGRRRSRHREEVTGESSGSRPANGRGARRRGRAGDPADELLIGSVLDGGVLDGGVLDGGAEAAAGADSDPAAATERFDGPPAEPPARGRRSRRERPDGPGGEDIGRPAEPSGAGGWKHRADDPWATGRWPGGPGRHGGAAHEDDQAAPAVGSPVVEPPVVELPAAELPAAELPAVEVPVAEAPSVAGPTAAPGEADGWLQSALAELDRALRGVGLGGSSADPVDPVDDGCTVVVDVSRDGRRFAGPRAAAVVHAVADLLVDRLPAGAHTRFGDSDALVIAGAGWSRAEATDWMHRTLPGLLDGFVTAEELPGTQLRAAVHDADGPVGAQILQQLTGPGRERDGAAGHRRGDAERGSDPWADLAIHASEARGREYRMAARVGREGRGDGARAGARPRRGRPADDDPPRWPFAAAAPEPDEEPAAEPARPAAPPAGTGTADRVATGRHGAAADRSTGPSGSGAPSGTAPAPAQGDPDREAAAASGTGPRRAGGPDGDGASAHPGEEERAAEEPDRPESTEGLGIADLLAGALAAYRGI